MSDNNCQKFDAYGRPVKGARRDGSASKGARKSANKAARSYQALLRKYPLPSYLSLIPFSDEYFEALVASGKLTTKALQQMRSCASSTKAPQDAHPIKGVKLTDDHYKARDEFWELVKHTTPFQDSLEVERRFHDEFSRRTRPAFEKWFGKVLELYGSKRTISTDVEWALQLATDRVISEVKEMMTIHGTRIHMLAETRETAPSWFGISKSLHLAPLSASKAFEMAKKNTNSGMCAGLDVQFANEWGHKVAIRDYAIINAERWVQGYTHPIVNTSDNPQIFSQFISCEGEESEKVSSISSVAAGMGDNDLWMLFARAKDEMMEGSSEARPIVCPTAIDKVAGKMFTAPVISLFQMYSRLKQKGHDGTKLNSTYAGFCGGEFMQNALRSDGFHELNDWSELDWKGFDRNCAGLLPYALRVMKSLYSPEYHKYLEDDLTWASNAKILTPEGLLIVDESGTMAMPSGWSKTSLYGTFCSRIAMEYLRIMSERENEHLFSHLYCFGDDVLMGHAHQPGKDVIRKISHAASDIGMVVNMKKCNQTSGDARFAAFLGYYHRPQNIISGQRGWFPLMRMAPKFLYDESYSALPKQWKNFLTLKTLSKLEVLSGRDYHAYRAIVKFVRELYADVISIDSMPEIGYALTEEEWEELRHARISRAVMTDGLENWISAICMADVLGEELPGYFEPEQDNSTVAESGKEVPSTEVYTFPDGNPEIEIPIADRDDLTSQPMASHEAIEIVLCSKAEPIDEVSDDCQEWQQCDARITDSDRMAQLIEDSAWDF